VSPSKGGEAMREWRREWRMVRQRDGLHTSHSETTRRADEMPRRAAKQETATGGSRASVRVGASTGPSGKQNSGAPDRAAGARSDGACRVRGSEWLERRQERLAAERAADSLRAAGDLQALGGVAGWRGRPASEPGRTSCTSTLGSRACAGTPACRRRAGQRCCREGTGRGRTVGWRGAAAQTARATRWERRLRERRWTGIRRSLAFFLNPPLDCVACPPGALLQENKQVGGPRAFGGRRAPEEDDEQGQGTTGRSTDGALRSAPKQPPPARQEATAKQGLGAAPAALAALGSGGGESRRLGGRDAVGWGPAAGRGGWEKPNLIPYWNVNP
jgi:hypothetical protein